MKLWFRSQRDDVPRTASSAETRIAYGMVKVAPTECSAPGLIGVGKKSALFEFSSVSNRGESINEEQTVGS